MKAGDLKIGDRVRRTPSGFTGRVHAFAAARMVDGVPVPGRVLIVSEVGAGARMWVSIEEVELLETNGAAVETDAAAGATSGP